MPLGWIDFSKTERSKVLTVLEMLTEQGTLDELGIAPIRDGFANLFFPGTSTIQTRAKYFFTVPYLLKDLEKSSESNPARILISLDARERRCGERFLSNNGEEPGIIGKRSLAGGNWVKRTPTDIYWAGLRQYGIFLGGNISLSEYVRAMCVGKKQRTALKKLGNRKEDNKREDSRREEAEENEWDDIGAGDIHKFQFWNMPVYTRDWFSSLKMELTASEGAFLKKQIQTTCPHSMMAYLLKRDLREVLDMEGFAMLSSIRDQFPAKMQEDYDLALAFSDFVYTLRVIYNRMVSDRQNEAANQEIQRLKPDFPDIASLDIDCIMNRLRIFNHPMLARFLNQARENMLAGDMDSLMKNIRDREVYLKGQSRAKTSHPGEFDTQAWFGGGALDYRFRNAKTIIGDIWESEVTADA